MADVYVFDNEEADEEEKDSSLHCLTFNAAISHPNSIAWSNDGRLVVVTESCLYVMTIAQTPKVRRVGSPFGLQIETTYVKNPDPIVNDVEISTVDFPDLAETPLMDRQLFLLDRSTVFRKDFMPIPCNYCQAKWSPIGCTADGRLLSC